jgi:hypothetical protein
VETKAYVLIEMPIGKAKDVFRILQQMEGVREADAMPGEYDIVAVIETANLNSIVGLVPGASTPSAGYSGRRRICI